MPTNKETRELIVNKLTKEQFKTVANANTNNEVYHITDDAHYTEAEIQSLLNTKQNTLTSSNAGTGISIQNGIISNTQTSAEWGNIQGDITSQTDLQNELDGKVSLAEVETITGAKTFTGAVNLIGSGDSNAVGISTNTRFNVYNTSKTVLGFGSGIFYINHGDYRLRLRGKDARPHYNSDSNYLALLSDIPDTSKFITMQDVEAKNYLTTIPDEYITQTELDDKGYARLVDIQGKADASTVNEQLELKADKLTTYTKSEVDDKIADAVTGGQIDLSGYAKDGEVVHLANSETITGSKTFTQPLKIQNGAGTGSLLIGGDINAGTVTNGARKLARIAVPTQANKDLTSILLGFDSNGDDALNITNRGSDNVSFGGSKKITNATSPMSISFCVAKERNATDASKKTYALEMDANEARFNSRPNYNGVNLATTVDVTNALGSYAKLTDIPDVSNYITMNDVEEKGYLTEVPSEYITETELNNKGYLTEHQDISNLATKTELTEGLATKQPTGNYALKSDIPDVSNFASKDELNSKQDTLTAGENIAIENNVISATINTSNLATKTEVANKQDKFTTSLPLTMGGLKTSTTNISYDNNGRAYLNEKAFWASIPELLPSIVGENRNEYASFDDSMNTAERAELTFRKLKGFNGVYPQLNLEGYNAIIRNFTVGDIVMGDRVDNKVQMCFGKLENDCTFTPKLICRLQGTSSDFYKFAKMMFLYEPSYTKLNTSSGAWDGDYYMEYRESGSFKTISYKRQNELGGIENLYGVKFIEKDGAYSLTWVTESGDIVELADSATFDKLDFNCVVFNAYTFELPKDEVPEYYSFNPERYFVAKDTIDNVVSKMIDGTGTDSLSIKYSDDFILNENNELKLKNAIPDINNLATKEDIKNKQSSLNDTSTIDVNDTDLTVIGVQSKSGDVLYDWIGTKEEYETGIANGSISEDWICWVTDNEGDDKCRSMPIGMVYSLNCTEDYIPDGSLPCNGSEYTSSQFKDLWDNYLTGGLLKTITYADYEMYVENYGQCAKFAVDEENEIFRVPLIKDTETVVTNNIDYDNGVEIGCPISTAPFTAPCDGVYMTTLTKGNTNGYIYVNGVHTPFYRGDATGGDSWDNFFVPLSKGDVIYWEVTLTPKASHFYPYKEETKEKLKSFVVVANGQINQSMMDWAKWSEGLSNKVDKSNLTECAVVVRVSDKSIAPSWYRIWSDGWCEQGGRLASATSQTVELLIEMSDINYCLTFGAYGTTSTDTEGWDMTPGSSDYTTTSFRATSVSGRNDNWKVEGYMRQ